MFVCFRVRRRLSRQYGPVDAMAWGGFCIVPRKSLTIGQCRCFNILKRFKSLVNQVSIYWPGGGKTSLWTANGGDELVYWREVEPAGVERLAAASALRCVHSTIMDTERLQELSLMPFTLSRTFRPRQFCDPLRRVFSMEGT